MKFWPFQKENASPPYAEIYEITLPEIDRTGAGFSGADIIPRTDQFIFTVSAEDMPNAIDDGQILGSLTGIINLNKLRDQYHPKTVEITTNDTLLKIKGESVIVQNSASNSADLIFVTDSDGGDSELLQARLQ